jgi:hypothetical protein
MKKTYINPEMEIVKIATQQMIATSGPSIGGEFQGGDDVDVREGDFNFE